MKRIAILIATTAGPVHVDRILVEPAPQSMICLRRSSEVLPISLDYDDFVRPGSGVIKRDFPLNEDGAFRLDVNAPIKTGKSWQLGVYAAHMVHDAPDLELSSVEEADVVLWLSGTVDYDLNVGHVDHIAEKVEASLDLLADFIARQKRIILCTGLENATTLKQHKPPRAFEIMGLSSAKDLGAPLERRPQPGLKEKKKSGSGFAIMAILALGAIASVFFFHQSGPLSLQVTSERGQDPTYRFGENLSLIVTPSQKAWVMCFYQQVDGKIIQLYPNRELRTYGPLDGGQAHYLTGRADSSFVVRLGPPAGQEHLACYASLKQMRPLSNMDRFNRLEAITAALKEQAGEGLAMDVMDIRLHP